jgi:hypothetical protein
MRVVLDLNKSFIHNVYSAYFRVEFNLPNLIGLLIMDIRINHNDNFSTAIILLFHKPTS